MSPHDALFFSTMSADSMGGAGALAMGLFMLIGLEHRGRLLAGGMEHRRRLLAGGVVARVQDGVDAGRKAWASIDQTLANWGTALTGVIAAGGLAYAGYRQWQKKNRENAAKAKLWDDLPRRFEAVENRLAVLATQAELAEKRWRTVADDYETLQSVMTLQSDNIATLSRSITIQKELSRLSLPKRDAWYICDSNGRTIDVSDGLCALFGMSRERMLGTGWLKPIEDKDAAERKWSHAIRSDIPYEDTYRIKVGERSFPVSTFATKISPGGDALFFGECWEVAA